MLGEGRRLGIEIVFLHGYGSHELDLVDRADAELVARIVALEAARCNDCRYLASVPRVVERGSIRVVRFGLGGRDVNIVSRVSSAMDDIPSYVYREVLKSVGDVVLVDAQNVYYGRMEWNDDEIRALVELVSRSLPNCEHYTIGVGRRNVPDCGVLQGGVAAVYLDACGSRLKILVIDGNNIADHVYRELRKYFDEVVTTDNHEETGITIGRGYRLVGEGRGCLNTVLDSAISALKDAEASASRVPICYKRVRFYVKVLGEDGFGGIRKLASRYARAALAVLLVYVVLPLILQVPQFLL